MYNPQNSSTLVNRRKFGKATGPPHADPDIVFGRHVIEAWLEAKPARLETVFLDAERQDRHRGVAEAAQRCGVKVEKVPRQVLERLLAGVDRYHGVAARCRPFPYVETAALLAAQQRLVVCVDRVQDPHNLGAIIRSAAAVGAGGLLLPKDNAVGISAVVEAASVGATAMLAIARVTNVARSLTEARNAGYWIAALTADAANSLYDTTLPEPLVLVVGGEAGMRPLVQAGADFLLSIPMERKVESLNVSVATAVALFEIRRRWLDTKKLVM